MYAVSTLSRSDDSIKLRVATRRNLTKNEPKPRSGDSNWGKPTVGSFTCLTYHIVFSTKYRNPTIKNDIRERLYEYMGGILRSNKGHMIEIGGVEDHVHMLAGMTPSIAVSDVVRDIKASSSRWMREELEVKHFKWQKGFGAFTVSFDRVEAIRNYIRNQKEHHKTKTFQEEYTEFLECHNIEYRLEYLFEDEQAC